MKYPDPIDPRLLDLVMRDHDHAIYYSEKVIVSPRGNDVADPDIRLLKHILAKLTIYAKIDLYNGLEASDQALEDFLTTDPQRYFPPVLRRRYKDLIPVHRLSRQILATLIANNIVNRMGPAFVKRIQVDTGADIVTIARAYVVAREICQCSDIWRTIELLDNEIPATLQQSMMFEVSRILRHADTEFSQ